MVHEVIEALKRLMQGYPAVDAEGEVPKDRACVVIREETRIENKRASGKGAEDRRYDEWVMNFRLTETRDAARCVMLYKLRKALETMGFFGFAFDDGARSRNMRARIRRWRA